MLLPSIPPAVFIASIILGLLAYMTLLSSSLTQPLAAQPLLCHQQFGQTNVRLCRATPTHSSADAARTWWLMVA